VQINERLDRWVARRFVPFLRLILRWRNALIVGSAGLILISLALVHSGWLTLVMFSRVEGDRIMADVVFPEGISSQKISETVVKLQQSGQLLASQLSAEY